MSPASYRAAPPRVVNTTIRGGYDADAAGSLTMSPTWPAGGAGWRAGGGGGAGRLGGRARLRGGVQRLQRCALIGEIAGLQRGFVLVDGSLDVIRGLVQRLVGARG